jgi:hypothetical protein
MAVIRVFKSVYGEGMRTGPLLRSMAKYLDARFDFLQRRRFPIPYRLCDRVFSVFAFSIKRHHLQILAERHDWDSHITTRDGVILAESSIQQNAYSCKEQASP